MEQSSKTDILSSEKSIADVADELVGLTKNLVKTAQTHDDLRIGFEKILEPALKDIGVESINPRYERLGERAKTIYSGRPDAVHGSVIIEYEPPNAFQSRKSVSDANGQLVDYITKESKGVAKDQQTPYKFIGVGFDGHHIFFVERKGKNNADETFFSSDVYEFNVQSAKTFLTYLRSLSRLPLTAENLAQTFGPSSSLAPGAVSALLDALENWGNKRTSVFFNEWRRLFGIVYGERFTNTQEKEALVLRKYYDVREQANIQRLLFCVHTYFALLMKFIAAELLTLKDSAFSSSFTLELTHASTEELRNKLMDIENGGVYARRGINNFLEGDFFCWYLSAWSPRLEDAIRNITRQLSEFEPATSVIDPESTRDLLKKLYEYLVPKEIRHKLGEYYTPDWLAECILDEAGYNGDISKRLLDPACGSGTFLVLAIKRVKENHKAQQAHSKIVQKITQNIWGFDLNPLAVIAARTNYLFALGSLIEDTQLFDIPIYLTDSVLTPSRTKASFYGEALEVGTSVGPFHIPPQWTEDRGLLLNRALPVVEQMVKNNYSVEEVTKGLHHKNLITSTNEGVAYSFCKKILDLEKDGKNGIWTRILKNAFAPVIGGKFDFVIGNPPWIRWNDLSLEYRKATLNMWKEYGLFSLKGLDSILGGGVKDFSMLFTYAAADYYLKEGDILAFLITQEVFKSKGAGEGFRRFRIGDKKHLKVIKAYDFVQIKPFEAGNKTAAIILKKGEKTNYPVSYEVWEKKKGVPKISSNLLLNDVKSFVDIIQRSARPIGSEVSPWQTLQEGLDEFPVIKGKNPYKGQIGARTTPYGVFWLELKTVRLDGNLIVRNLVELGKTKIRQLEALIEPDLVYPVIRGADIKRWRAEPTIFNLIMQHPKKRIGIPEGRIKKDYPLTYTYLLNFKEELKSRATLKRYYNDKAPFYSQFNISENTFAHYKVVWGRMSNDIAAAVVSDIKTIFGYKNIIPLDTTAFISTETEAEAHYICAIINSMIVRGFIKSFSSAGRGFGAPSSMKYLNIPKYDSKNKLHLKLANASKKLHDERTAGHDDTVLAMEAEVAPLVLQLFADNEESKNLLAI